MLTRARSLFSRVFALESPPTQVRLDEMFDDIDDEASDDNEPDDAVEDESQQSGNGIDHDGNDDDDEDEEESSSDSDDEWSSNSQQASATNVKRKGKYERQINECPTNDNNANKNNYSRSHEKSRNAKLINSMQIATSRCNVESMKRLLTNFDIDINHRDQYGMSYLEHAILMGSFDMVDLLIRFGCDLYQGDSNGHSYLYVAIETTTNKSLAIIRLLLESNCSCLRLMDIASLTSPKQLMFINSQDFLLLNAHLLFIFKYQIRRMVLSDVLNLVAYLILTNILLCKNDEHFGLSACSKTALTRFNYDYLHLFVKTLTSKHVLKLEQKLKSSSTLTPTSSTLIPLNTNDIHTYLERLHCLNKQVFDLRHLCRSLIRQNMKNLKSSTIESIVKTSKLQDYLLYTPI